MTPEQLVVTLIGGLGGLAGVGALFNAFFSRGKSRAEAAQVITGAAVTWMTEFEEEAKAARDEVRKVRTEAHALADELHALRRAIMSPDATVEGLRLLVAGPGTNGRGR